ncbi:TetR/AcrR family transcriptional regulator [Nocardia sp. NBC_00565]|uniref:TetR/AcrR family transcriptional regulator n=1 Tax=Nocardia sp. NBC_00565 TaxID=2975993 RepID=UPI002E8074F4|nr:TetR/AcrR family transcriptional regulator [Nocardia sp. NBC_00565]WUC06339.1 TetR/AcrR family transcriptional regulator [Nocardia sp. NBC_00565]
MARIPAEQRRQDFVEAAVDVIGTYGVSGATTRRIAAAADAPLATLHYCFHTKEDLFVAVFQTQNEGMAERLEVEEGIGLGKAAVDILVSSADWYMENPRYARAQFDLFLWATRQKGDHAQLAPEIIELFLRRFVDAFERAADDGDDRALLIPLANFLISTLDGLVLEWCAHQDLIRFKAELALASEAIELLVRNHRTTRD